MNKIDPNFTRKQLDIIGKVATIVRNIYFFDAEVTFVHDISNKYTANNEKAVGGMAGRRDDLVIAINPAYFPKGVWNSLDFIKTVAHEMIHVKQYHTKELVIYENGLIIYKGQEYRMDNELEYWFAPWEVEARGMEDAIARVYQLKHGVDF